MTLTHIVNGTQVHTSISKALKNKITALSKQTKVPQAVIFNTAVAHGLAAVTSPASMEVTRATFKRAQKVTRKKTAIRKTK